MNISTRIKKLEAAVGPHDTTEEMVRIGREAILWSLGHGFVESRGCGVEAYPGWPAEITSEQRAAAVRGAGFALREEVAQAEPLGRSEEYDLLLFLHRERIANLEARLADAQAVDQATIEGKIAASREQLEIIARLHSHTNPGSVPDWEQND